MMYRITIEEVIETDEKKYPDYKQIYVQNIANINISETVKFLNKGETVNEMYEALSTLQKK